MPKKKKIFFCLVLFEGTCTFFKNKKSKRVIKYRSQGFSYNFCMMIEGSGSGAWSGSIPRIREAQKRVDPVDPDPQHWLLDMRSSRHGTRQCWGVEPPGQKAGSGAGPDPLARGKDPRIQVRTKMSLLPGMPFYNLMHDRDRYPGCWVNNKHPGSYSLRA